MFYICSHLARERRKYELEQAHAPSRRAVEQLELKLGMDWRPPAVRELFFFSVMPDHEAAARITALGRNLTRRHGLSGRLHPADRLHVSLLGFRVHGRDELITLAAKVGAMTRASPFDVVLSTALSFGTAPLRPLVLRCGGGSEIALKELQAALFDVAQAKLGLRRRSSFVPHLTLAYREPAIPITRLDDPITWPARELVLVRSEQGRGRYSYIGRWPLRRQ